MNIKAVLEAGQVMRYHSTLIREKQSNSEHQYEVAVILSHIYPEGSKELMLYALTHDSSEIFTGDMPAPIKREEPKLKQVLDQIESTYRREILELPFVAFTKEEYLAVKYADILSGIYFTSMRMAQGDTYARPIRDKWVRYFGSLPYLNETTLQTLEALK